MTNLPIISGLLLILVVVFYTGGKLYVSNGPTPPEINENYQNYRPERNSFRTYFRRDTFQGQRVDWKPSMPYHHLTPEYGAYARKKAEKCLATDKVDLQ